MDMPADSPANLEAVDIANVYAVIEVPENCVEVTIQCKVYMDGELMTVWRTMGMKEIQHAIKEAEDCYIPEDAIFQLTEEGKRYVEELERKEHGG